MTSWSRTSSILHHLSPMATKTGIIHFGPYEVTDQVFYHSSSCYALVNIKPILPGHVLVIPYRPVQRLIELTTGEVTDLFSTVQKVQKMLARYYFRAVDQACLTESGSFNLAIQDGKEAGQTVPHLHCHIIPRPKNDQLGDEIYQKLQAEEGNIGGGYYDINRPKQLSRFPIIEDEQRKPRSLDDMKREAAILMKQMTLLTNEQ